MFRQIDYLYNKSFYLHTKNLVCFFSASRWVCSKELLVYQHVGFSAKICWYIAVIQLTVAGDHLLISGTPYDTILEPDLVLLYGEAMKRCISLISIHVIFSAILIGPCFTSANSAWSNEILKHGL